MKSSLALVSILSLALAGPLEIRASDRTSAILKDISTLQSDTIKLNNTLNGISDSGSVPFGTLITLDNEVKQLETDLNTTTAASNSSSHLTGPDSKSISSALDKYEPVILSTLQNIINHKEAFANSGVTSVIESGLKDNRELARELANSLVKKATSSYKSSITTIGNAILAKFDTAIANY